MIKYIENILIVEDEPAVRVIEKVLLLKSRFEIENIYEAEHGIDGIDVLNKKPVDLILTDINMPVMNGIEFLDIVHNHPEYKDIPAIAVTTETGEKLLNMLAFWGHGYIEKPFTLGTLEEQISKFYGQDNEYYLHG